jgi:hypothetical protein
VCGIYLGLSTGARYFVRKIKNGLCIKLLVIGLGFSTGERFFVRTKKWSFIKVWGLGLGFSIEGRYFVRTKNIGSWCVFMCGVYV